MPDRTYSAVVPASGNMTISVQPTKNRPWIIEQVTIEMKDAPSGAIANLRKNGSLVSPMVAAGDVADSAPPVTLQPGDTMTVEWTGATQGLVGKAFVIYGEGQ